MLKCDDKQNVLAFGRIFQLPAAATREQIDTEFKLWQLAWTVLAIRGGQKLYTTDSVAMARWQQYISREWNIDCIHIGELH